MTERLTAESGEDAHKVENESIEFSEAIKENVKQHLSLRFKFAAKMCSVTGRPLAEVLFTYTDIYNLLGFGHARNDMEANRINPEWYTYVASIGDYVANDELALDTTVTKYLQTFQASSDLEGSWHKFYPFGYRYDVDDKTVYTLFGLSLLLPNETPVEAGPLKAENFETQKAKIKEMFTEVRRLHPEATTVKGRSWLYNLEGYRRLYPPEYTEDMKLSLDHYRGDSRWGQFVDSNGRVNQARAAQFLKNIQNIDVNNVEATFPMQRYEVEADIHAFYKFYGIE